MRPAAAGVGRTLAACLSLLGCRTAFAEGIGVFSPSQGEIVMLVWLPLLGTVLLGIRMLASSRLRGDLGRAIAIVAGMVALGVLGVMSLLNGGGGIGAAFVFLGLAFSPWIVFLIFLACLVMGERRKPAAPAPSDH